jgi:ABC-type enterochelin transport system substrate-binding protein
MTRKSLRILALGFGLSLAIAACSSSGSSSQSSATSSAATASAATVSLKGAVVQVIDAAPSPAVAGLDEGYRQAAQKLGITLEFAQSNGDPTTDISTSKTRSPREPRAYCSYPSAWPATRPL